MPTSGHSRFARRAAELLAHPDSQGEPAEPFTTRELARWLGVSVQFLEIARSKGTGPEFVRLGPTLIRYRRLDVNRWLLELRAHQSTAEYPTTQQAGPGRPRKAVAS